MIDEQNENFINPETNLRQEEPLKVKIEKADKEITSHR